MEKVYAPSPDPSRRGGGQCMQSSSGNLIGLPLSPSFVRDFLHRREEILKDAPRAEVDLGVHQHAGKKAKPPALMLEAAPT